MKEDPFMAVLGKKDEEARLISLRRHTQGDLGCAILDDAIQRIKSEIIPSEIHPRREEYEESKSLLNKSLTIRLQQFPLGWTSG